MNDINYCTNLCFSLSVSGLHWDSPQPTVLNCGCLRGCDIVSEHDLIWDREKKQMGKKETESVRGITAKGRKITTWGSSYTCGHVSLGAQKAIYVVAGRCNMRFKRHKKFLQRGYSSGICGEEVPVLCSREQDHWLVVRLRKWEQQIC